MTSSLLRLPKYLKTFVLLAALAVPALTSGCRGLFGGSTETTTTTTPPPPPPPPPPTPTLAVTGPTSVRVAMQAAYVATLSDTTKPPVQWAVNGKNGGDATV